MRYNFVFRDASEALPELLRNILHEGNDVGSRNGRCLELTHVGITLEEPWRREILVPHRKVNVAAQIAETMWVLGGRNDMEFLSYYLPRAKDFSDDGETWRAGYGARLRKWRSPEDDDHYAETDQFRECYRLLKEDPMTRRAVMSIWDPALDYADSKDIPCNNWLSWSLRDGQLDLMVAIRSNDIIWGWSGINAFEWSTMLEVMAGLLGVEVGALHFATTSLHLYEPHFDKARNIAETEGAWFNKLEPVRFKMPSNLEGVAGFDDLVKRWFQLEYDIRTGSPLVDEYIERFPEPMMQSWLRVLQWWWYQGRRDMLEEGTRLEAATLSEFSVQPKKPQPTESEFLQHAIALHDQKHAAYGDSWRRRGEMLGIMANIARKIDRLGTAETDDETQADTALDLFVYLAKYKAWIEGDRSNDTMLSNNQMREVELKMEKQYLLRPTPALEENLRDRFDKDLEGAVSNGREGRRNRVVEVMLEEAYALARRRFEKIADQG